MRLRAGIALALAAWVIAGCAFVPQRSIRLEEARKAYQEAAADPQVTLHAAVELRQAAELLDQAAHARDTLDDIAVVDHLAYVAKQRVAIALETAKLRARGP